MPDRIIKESICTSDTLNKLSDFEERLWHRLIVNCDDYGRFDARPAILRGRLFPLMENKTLKNVTDGVKALASVGLVALYEVDGKPFLQVVTWEKHQRIRAKRSKFPSPDDACCQMTAYDVKCPRNPIQSESESESNAEDSPEPPAASGPPVCLLPMNTGEEYPVFQEQAEEWAALYPAVDVTQELKAMRGWCLANPQKRKTKRGISTFINRWLANEQDKPGKEKSRGMGRTAGEAARQEYAGHIPGTIDLE